MKTRCPHIQNIPAIYQPSTKTEFEKGKEERERRPPDRRMHLFARQKGYKPLTLWTNDILVSARRIYQAAGFKLISEEKHHSFGKDLVGQYRELAL